MAEANREDWARLASHSDEELIHTTGGYLFGPIDGPFASYVAAVEAGGAEVEHLGPIEVNRRCPALHLDLEDVAIHDPSAGVIFARRSLQALHRRCEALGVELRTGSRVTRLQSRPGAVVVHTDGGLLETERVVVTAGPWTQRLVPALASRLSVRRQSVAFFDGVKRNLWRLGGLTPWVWIGAGDEDVYYGLPAVDADGPKVGHHQVAGGVDDPDRLDATPCEETVRRITERTARLFDARDLRVKKRETCYYTLTTSEDFILDHHPEDPRIVFGAGFPGHGFKLVPLTGRILAELSCAGQTTVEAFEADRDRFRLGG